MALFAGSPICRILSNHANIIFRDFNSMVCVELNIEHILVFFRVILCRHRRELITEHDILAAKWQSVLSTSNRVQYNIILPPGEQGKKLRMARTVFLPKGHCYLSPGLFRPLLITSVVSETSQVRRKAEGFY